MNYDEKIQSLNLVLPPSPQPVGSYQPVTIHGNWAFLSGQISKRADGHLITGKVGSEISLEEAQEAAKWAGLNALSILKNLVGFNRFDRIVRVVGYIQSAPNFFDHSKVMNAASDLFLGVFGEKGIHARSSIGMATLPLNSAVEVELTVALK